MPSTLDWYSAQRTPVYQVYGTKRKLKWEDHPPDSRHLDLSNKRRCMENNVVAMNHTLPSDQLTHPAPPLHLKHLQTPPHRGSYQPSHGNHGILCQVPIDISVANKDTQNANSQEDNRIMDLCDEVYTNNACPNVYASPDTYASPDMPCDNQETSMEANCAPDQAQYNTRKFCPEYMCSGGDSSPTSGRVRCYCKPGWDTAMSDKPYYSDIY